MLTTQRDLTILSFRRQTRSSAVPCAGGGSGTPPLSTILNFFGFYNMPDEWQEKKAREAQEMLNLSVAIVIEAKSKLSEAAILQQRAMTLLLEARTFEENIFV